MTGVVLEKISNELGGRRWDSQDPEASEYCEPLDNDVTHADISQEGICAIYSE